MAKLSVDYTGDGACRVKIARP